MAVVQTPAEVAGAPVEPRAARSSRWRTRWPDVVVLLPELVAVAVAGFAVPTMLLLLAGQFRPVVAIPLGLAGALAAVPASGLLTAAPLPPGFGSPLPGQRRVPAALLTVVAAVLILGWLLVNLRYYAQDVYAQRDPATYTLAARWLMSHPSLVIQTHVQLFGFPAGFDETSAGFAQVQTGTVHAQGNHLLPVLLACLGAVFGSTAILQGNMIIGALALFTMFGVARQIAGPVFAFMAVAALAVSMPFIYVTRDSYSEPLALLLTMGGLSLLYRALRTGRNRDYVTAGFVTGATAMVRIDAYVTLLSLLIVAGVAAGLVGRPTLAASGRRALALLGPALIGLAIGLTDVHHLSPNYYHNQLKQITAIFKGGIVLAVLSVIVAFLLMRPPIRTWVAAVTRTRVMAGVLGAAIVAAVVVLATRPNWMQTHGVENEVVATTQKLAGLPVDGTRTYNEQTLNWQAMYFGWPVIYLAVAGYVLLMVRLVRRRDLALLGVLTVGLSMSALYLWTSEITPDQVWAMRRYVPVVLPILLIAAAYVLARLWAALATRWSGRGLPMPVLWVSRLALLAVAVSLVWTPWTVTRPVFHLREEVPQLAQLESICAALPPDAAVLIVDDGLRWGYGQALRSYCDVPTLAVLETDSAALAQVRTSVQAGGKTLYVMAARPQELPYAGADPSDSFSTVTTTRWPSVIDIVPVGPATQQVAVYLGTVGADGLVTAVSR